MQLKREARAQVLRLQWHWAYCARLPDLCCAESRGREFLHFRRSRVFLQSAGQLVAEAVINGVRVADALVDTGIALSMLSAAKYARLPDAPAIQPFLRVAPEVVGVEGASAMIRGYVDVPVEIAGVAVRHQLLVVEGLAFHLIIGTDIWRAHRAVLTLDKSAPVRLQIRKCAVCLEQRTASPAEP